MLGIPVDFFFAPSDFQYSLPSKNRDPGKVTAEDNFEGPVLFSKVGKAPKIHPVRVDLFIHRGVNRGSGG